MRIKGLRDYFSDPWNLADIFHFIVFAIYFKFRISNNGEATILYMMKDYWAIRDFKMDLVNDMHKIMMILNSFIVLMALVKILQFMRTFEMT
jgi:hypothetical protein